MTWDRSRRSAAARDERGSTLPLVALIVVTLMTCAALTVDLGLVTAKNRRLQGVADLGAIAGSYALIGAACNHSYMVGTETVPSTVFNHVRQAVVDNAAQNDFPVGGTKSLVIEVGTIAYPSGAPVFTPIHSSASGVDCTSAAVPTAVRVTAGDFTDYGFGPVIGNEGKVTYRSGVASRRSDGGGVCTPVCSGSGGGMTGAFTIGSSIANINSTNSPVLNSVLQSMVCRNATGTCSFNVAAGSWAGLANANVTLGQIRSQTTFGSVSQMLNSTMKAGDFYLYMARALGCSTTAGCSNTAAVTLLNLSATLQNSATFKLNNWITVVAGGESAAAASTFNVLHLITGSAQVINGVNTVSVPSAAINIPGAPTTLSLKVTELPRTYIGPVGGSVSTSQVEVDAVQTVNLANIPIAGSVLGNLATVSGNLPVKITAGSATGTLVEVSCVAPKGEVVSVDTQGASTVIGDNNTANRFLDVKVGGLIPVTVAQMNVNATATVAGVSGNQMAFAYPTEYYPATLAPRHVGGTNLNVQGLGTVSTNLSVPLLSIDAPSLTSAMVGPTGPVGLLDRTIVSPVLQALGITVAGADVWAIGAPGCGVPTLAG